MKTIFTIHAGEYLVGSAIEKQCKDWEIWLPSRDTGIDLLMRHKQNKTTKSIQVKFSKSWTETHTKEEFRRNFNTQGWWSLNKQKIKNSPADFWIFALYSFDNKKHDYLIFPKEELIHLYRNIGHWNKVNRNGNEVNTIQSYFWTFKNNTAIEGRGVTKKQLSKLFKKPDSLNTDPDIKKRNVSNNLNNWSILTKP